ncbi:serine protease [Oceanirhabdus seepicola]|uniref:Trypsin-like peptidase domain-containing protein n=1 Tax=Oceanirhabdus seepicola TaxID=2828781 RepID=A0A9J6P4V4_9CLOT|nr:serine protease [Oceanirhabdus seepicola]MCM1990664.1 trypsin-like peptidase domain-containing protein [Oceanirhabdus seepicola]
MIVNMKPLKTILMETNNPLEDIKCVSNTKRNPSSKSSLKKSVIFCRYIGMKDTEIDYLNKLKNIDKYLESIEGNYLKFTNGLGKDFDINEIENMKLVMDNYINFENQKQVSPSALFKLNIGYEINNECLEWTKKLAFKEILKLYDANNKNSNKTIRKNFGVKMLLWMNKYLKQLFGNNSHLDAIHKILFYGDIKKHELYFLMLLSKLGCDILYINPKEDIEYQFPEVIDYSNVIKYKKMHDVEIQFPRVAINSERPLIHSKKTLSQTVETKEIEKDFHKDCEKSYEELATLAKSVVMINVYGENRKFIGGGSGVVISDNGFIITNFHVVNKGLFFGVVFENDNNEYMTYNIVKYHPDYDLALIKVDNTTKPVILNEKHLVRGQKVIAIGSPLGLFNTISDGIVSGFREFDRVKTVQITAPISPGSSGGALFDMYGKLVGITTSGFDAQNINLAVPAQCVNQFAGNIFKKT